MLSVNGTPVEIRLDKGYALLDRVWNPADRIVLELPVAPRLVRAHKAARELDGMAAIAAGPLVYCIEQADNTDYARLRLDTAGSMELGYRSDLMDGTPVITGTAIDGKGAKSTFTAIPYYAFGNRGNGGYLVADLLTTRTARAQKAPERSDAFRCFFISGRHPAARSRDQKL